MSLPRLVIGILPVLVCSMALAAGDRYHDEKFRPQFHFTPDKGWMNDPNGLVFYEGDYHLFFQHNPHGTNWISELSWGHAVSRDLVHWEYLPDVLPPLTRPDGKPAGSWSGSALVDFNNSSGFGKGAEKPIVLVWTATGLGQCIAYSVDGGRTFTPYEHNPVIAMDPPKTGDWDRDPKVYWHEPTKKWVMAFSISGKGVVFYSSSDLKRWTYESLVPDLFECPDFFELPIDGDSMHTKWMIWDASGKYFVGNFDGHAFTKEAGPFLVDYGHSYYAAQTWNNAPDGRRIGIAWLRDGRYPDMPFNGQMSVPFELTLHKTQDGVRLAKLPVKELEQLRYDTKQLTDIRLGHWKESAGETFDLQAEIEPKGASAVVMKVRGATIRYTPGLLRVLDQVAPLKPVDARIKLRVLVDRASVEVFANDGLTSVSCTFLPRDNEKDVEASSETGAAQIVFLRLSKMHSIWAQ